MFCFGFASELNIYSDHLSFLRILNILSWYKKMVSKLFKNRTSKSWNFFFVSFRARPFKNPSTIAAPPFSFFGLCVCWLAGARSRICKIIQEHIVQRWICKILRAVQTSSLEKKNIFKLFNLLLLAIFLLTIFLKGFLLFICFWFTFKNILKSWKPFSNFGTFFLCNFWILEGRIYRSKSSFRSALSWLNYDIRFHDDLLIAW